MKQKHAYIIISFETTTQAMAFECICDNKVKGRLIPLPPIIHAGCGLAWKSPIEEKRNLLDLFQKQHIEFDEMHELE